MTDNKLNQQIELKDGRMLGYAEYGAHEGKPVFYFHGFPGLMRRNWMVSRVIMLQDCFQLMRTDKGERVRP
jgi:hypothetical protein